MLKDLIFIIFPTYRLCNVIDRLPCDRNCYYFSSDIAKSKDSYLRQTHPCGLKNGS